MIKRVKRQPAKCNKIFVKDPSSSGLISRYTKNSNNSTVKQQMINEGEGQRTCADISTRAIYNE